MIDGIFLDNRGPYPFDMVHELSLVDMSTLENKLPDPNWYSIDSKGHFHAFTTEGVLPTLKLVTEEYHTYCTDVEDTLIAEYRCIICSEAITPAYRNGLEAKKAIPGTRSTRLFVNNYYVNGFTDLGVGDRMSFYTKDVFGVAVINHMVIESGHGLKLELNCLFVSPRGVNNDLPGMPPRVS